MVFSSLLLILLVLVAGGAVTADCMGLGACPGVGDLACAGLKAGANGTGPIAGALAATRRGAVCKTGL